MSSKSASTQEFLLSTAKKEFLRHGYRNVSMRRISERTGMALGNIYYYYKTKDELYRAITDPIIKKIDEYWKFHNDPRNIMLDLVHMEKEDYGDYFKSQRCMSFFTMLIDNRDDLYMLFFQSSGSSLENYEDILREQMVAFGYEYIEEIKQIYHREIKINKMFMNIHSATMVNMIKEIIRHEKLPWGDIIELYTQFGIYSMSGWKALMRI